MVAILNPPRAPSDQVRAESFRALSRLQLIFEFRHWLQHLRDNVARRYDSPVILLWDCMSFGAPMGALLDLLGSPTPSELKAKADSFDWKLSMDDRTVLVESFIHRINTLQAEERIPDEESLQVDDILGGTVPGYTKVLRVTNQILDALQASDPKVFVAPHGWKARRANAIHKLKDTERRYISQLSDVSEAASNLYAHSDLSDTCLETFIVNCSRLIPYHTIFSRPLNKLPPAGQEVWDEIFMFTDKLLRQNVVQAYQALCGNYLPFSQYLTGLKETQPENYRDCNLILRHLSRILDRVSEYQTILQNILEVTLPTNANSYDSLCRMTFEMFHLTETINEVGLGLRTMWAATNLESRLTGVRAFSSRGLGSVLLDDRMIVDPATGLYYSVFLFQHIFLCCRERRPDPPTRAQYPLKAWEVGPALSASYQLGLVCAVPTKNFTTIHCIDKQFFELFWVDMSNTEQSMVFFPTDPAQYQQWISAMQPFVQRILHSKTVMVDEDAPPTPGIPTPMTLIQTGEEILTDTPRSTSFPWSAFSTVKSPTSPTSPNPADRPDAESPPAIQVIMDEVEKMMDDVQEIEESTEEEVESDSSEYTHEDDDREDEMEIVVEMVKDDKYYREDTPIPSPVGPPAQVAALPEPKAAEPNATEPKQAEPRGAEPTIAEPKAAKPEEAKAKEAEPKPNTPDTPPAPKARKRPAFLPLDSPVLPSPGGNKPTLTGRSIRSPLRSPHRPRAQGKSSARPRRNFQPTGTPLRSGFTRKDLGYSSSESTPAQSAMLHTGWAPSTAAGSAFPLRSGWAPSPFLPKQESQWDSLDLSGEVSREGDHAVAHGGQSDTWVGKWTKEKTGEDVKVAIKVLRKSGKDSKKKLRLLDAWQRHLKAWHCLEHEHVLPLFGVMRDSGLYPSVICPWRENGSVSAYLESSGNTIQEAERLRMVHEVALGLEYIHSKSIIHGSLTGHNILLDKDLKVQITDVGISSVMEEMDADSKHDMPFTPLSARSTVARWRDSCFYEVPEGFGNGKSQWMPPTPTAKTDVYSLGSVMLEILSGLPPYHYIALDDQVVIELQNGHLPQRPANSSISDPQWDFIQWCWTQPSDARPDAGDVVIHLAMFREMTFIE